jgi:uncharacterized protein (TIGR02452 family)
MLISRERAVELGQETVAILKAGRYRTRTGRVVEIGEALERAVAGTCSYPPSLRLPDAPRGGHRTRFEVENETTLAVIRRLVESGRRPLALNFASAKHPGGGFLSGARAQEESLARSSGLFTCLAGNEMYDYHRGRRDPFYSDYAIYSPDVAILRTDDGELLETPYLCSILTAPAVNANAVAQHVPERLAEVPAAMRARIARVLAIAAIHGHEVLILGAWGCGAFGNDSEVIAGLFRDALTGPFEGVFAGIVFAITDWSPERRFIGPFQRAFDRPGQPV